MIPAKSLSCDAKDCPYEGKPEDRRSMTFGMALDRIVVYCIGGLVAFLCVSTLDLRSGQATLIERSDSTREQQKIFHQELERLTATDQVLIDAIKRLQINQAKHGWDEGRP